MCLCSQHYTSLRLPVALSRLRLTSLYHCINLNIESARDYIFQQIDLLPPSSVEAETCYQILTRLIYVHTGRHPSPAALKRDVLENAMTAFPNNTCFLSLYLQGEIGRRIYGRLQQLVDQLTRNGSVTGLLWSVWAEATSSSETFWQFQGAERVRMALDRGISSTRYA